VRDQDELRLEVWGKKDRVPNKPGTSKRRHYDRPNQKRSRKSFMWEPPGPKFRDVATTGKLAPAGRVGYRELDDVVPEEEMRRQEEKRERGLDALRTRKEELTRELGEWARGQAAASPDAEVARLGREVEELERLKGAKQRLDDRDEWKREKDEKFRAAFVDPPKEKFVTEAERTRKAGVKDKKAEAQTEFMRQPQAQLSRRRSGRRRRRRKGNHVKRRRSDERRRREADHQGAIGRNQDPPDQTGERNRDWPDQTGLRGSRKSAHTCYPGDNSKTTFRAGWHPVPARKESRAGG
jgi:hypothetical protein